MNDTVYRAVIRVARALFAALGLRIEVTGAEHVPAAGPVVVAANHTSFVDFLVVGLPAVERGRLVRFMAKESAFRAPVAGWLLRGMRHIPVDRRHGAVAGRRALQALRRGEVVGVYPEATISSAFAVKGAQDLRRGAAHLALSTGAPLVPIAHWGVHRVFTVGPRVSLRRGHAVLVTVGAPVVPDAGESVDALTARLGARLDEMVEALVDRYPQRPAEQASAWWWPAERGGGAPDRDTARTLDAEAVAHADRVRAPRPRGTGGRATA